MNVLRKNFRLSILSAILIATNYLGNAQEEVPLGTFTQNDINLQECSFDPEADAVIISHSAESNYDEDYRLVTNHRIKFKILKEKGIERSNIKIRYYSADDFEFISNLKAFILSYNDNKEILKTQLEPKNSYKKKLNKLYSELSFTMPSVRVGSIIEYKYTSVMKHYGGLQDWYFQKDLPVMFSSYKLNILPGAEFAYTVYKSLNLPVVIQPDQATGSIYYEMRNIPGLRDELYMGAARDYMQRINFQLAGIDRFGQKTKYTTTWKQLAQELLNEKYFGSQIGKSLAGVDKALWETASSPIEKMKRIHNYVRGTMVWDYIYSKYSNDNIKDAWDKKRGNSGDINLILINLLKEAELEVSPLLVSERDNGKVDTSYPYQDQFNKVVAYVTIGDKNYILDATEKQTPSHLVPFKLLNTKAFVVERKNPRLISIAPTNARDYNVVTLIGSVDHAGRIKGKTLVANYEYAKLNKSSDYLSAKSKYEDDFIKPYSPLKADSFKVEGYDSDSLPLKHEIFFSNELGKSGDYYLLNYNLFTGLTSNPFVAKNRFTTIDFGTKYSCVVNETFVLPDNLQVESVPKNVKLVTPENSMAAYTEIEKIGKEIIIRLTVEINKTEFPAESYSMVQDFYKKMFETLNEPVLLKSK